MKAAVSSIDGSTQFYTLSSSFGGSLMDSHHANEINKLKIDVVLVDLKNI